MLLVTVVLTCVVPGCKNLESKYLAGVSYLGFQWRIRGIAGSGRNFVCSPHFKLDEYVHCFRPYRGGREM